MNSFQALLVDVDGTLVKTDKSISSITIKSITSLRKRGIVVGLCTGRDPITLHSIFSQLGWFGLHVTAGGAQVFDAQQQVAVWESVIDEDVSRELVKEIIARGGQVVLRRPDAVYGYRAFLEKVLSHPWEVVVKPLNQLEQFSTPLITVHDVGNNLADYLRKLTQVHAVEMLSSEGKRYFDITALEVSKLTGLEQWSSRLNISLDRCVGIGDSPNDTEFLSRVGLPVAMGNATDNIKQLSKLIVGSNEEDGVVEAIEQVWGGD